MGCFFFFSDRPKSRDEQGSPRSVAGKTLSTATTSSFNYDTSRSYGFAGGMRANKSSASTSSQRSISVMFEAKAGSLRVFELGELRNATNGFSQTLKIGEGEFRSVYKGFIRAVDGKGDRNTVSVKVLNLKGMQVMYRDFKASNILLDDDFRPRLSDFGLAREGPTGDRTHVSTTVVGTFGYAAPDYIETGRLTIKSDVWSFGVVLYELLTGRHWLDRNRPSNERKLLDWVKQVPVESKRFNMIMVPRLRYLYSLKAAREVAKLANSCLAKQAKERPRMSQVVQVLIHIVQISEAKLQ